MALMSCWLGSWLALVSPNLVELGDAIADESSTQYPTLTDVFFAANSPK
ncbi:MAG: hypothetical protein KME23_03500 [Goleter apudmare HA4340-LM2]|nr:hypothetical protein [Goleter apudmare HA4340-LM2]